MPDRSLAGDDRESHHPGILTRFRREGPPPGYSERTYELLTLVIPDQGKTSLPLFGGRVWANDASDIAFLELVPGGPMNLDHVWEVPVLELRPPKVGERVFAFGYPRSSVSMKSPGNFEARTGATTSAGTVTEVHEIRRDRGFLKFPSFETNARFDPGMSGGPVFNAQGHVCGIIASGLSEGGQSTDHRSAAWTLWPAMGLMVNFTWEERYSRGTYFPMYEFAKAKMETRGLDDLSVAVNADGTTTVSCRRKRFVE
jgi:Trypsin-like peptidase domain